MKLRKIALKRNSEELNIDIKVKEYLCSSFFDYNHISIELMAYTCEWQSGKLKNNEHQALSWLNPEELRGLDMSLRRLAHSGIYFKVM